MELDNQDNQDIESRILGIRQTLEKLGQDMTDDEFSEIKGEGWDSAEAELSIKSGEEHEEYQENENYRDEKEHKVLGNWLAGEGSEALADYDLVSDLKEKELYDMKGKVNQLQEIVKMKDDQIEKMLRDYEESIFENQKLREIIKGHEKKTQEHANEIRILKKSLKSFEHQRYLLEDDLSNSHKNIERLKRTLRIKDDTISSMSKLKPLPEKLQLSLKEPEVIENTERLAATSRAEDSYKLICSEAMKIVGVSKTKDFYSKLSHLQSHHSKYKKSIKLIDRLSDMVVQCSPSGSFKKEPTIHQIWRWVVSLVEEYMKIKKLPSSSILDKLMNYTGTHDPDSLFDKIQQVIKT